MTSVQGSKISVPFASSSSSQSQRTKSPFGDCALVEIVHLHDCLRGALRALQQDVTELSRSVQTGSSGGRITELERRVASRFTIIWSVFRAHSAAEDEFIWPALQDKRGPNVVEQVGYVEDHANEEEMFQSMDQLLANLRESLLVQEKQEQQKETATIISRKICDHTKHLLDHLMCHLEREEKQCMPLVREHLTKEEIHDLVGQIMGKRSSDTIAQILSMAVQNLNESDREEMVRYMKQAMMGTFFEKWLAMSGWMESSTTTSQTVQNQEKSSADDTASESDKKRPASSSKTELNKEAPQKKLRSYDAKEIRTQAELEKVIRSVALNKDISSVERNSQIQEIRDSYWKSSRHGISSATYCTVVEPESKASSRNTPPAAFYKKKSDAATSVLVWRRGCIQPEDVPLFSVSELAPTYHDGATGGVFGCPHYARSCKLRHPASGRLYTCRLCCAQERENPLKAQDSALDRYSVTEVMCMKCTTLQPAGEKCYNPECESQGARFAKYYCDICHLYDDDPAKDIYHCPFCNVCRSGKGLGIDYKHCMRCNACVSMESDHHCIPQRLQATCPICHESMFQSTEPLRGLKCGHVLHLSCFTKYMRGQNYTCPLCKKSVEDMRDYFSMLDAAVRMQPMPATFVSVVSDIYCQDCGKTSKVPYHFVGCKCSHCGSYNTRELSRSLGATPSS